jgi:hypothetical protein
MAAISSCGSYVEVAKRRFPRSVNRIRGNGAYALISRCVLPWAIFLFDTDAQRAEAVERWGWNKCVVSSNCRHEHFCENL